MPEMRIKEVRLPELRLPEMTRDDIARTIGEKTREIDLSKLDPRRADLSGLEDITRDLQKVDLPKVDLPKAVAALTTIGRPRRSRLPFVIGGLLTLGLLAFAVASSPILRPRLEEFARRARARIDEMRADGEATMDEPVAFDAAIAMPIEPSAFADQVEPAGNPYDGPADLPDGFGAATADLSPVAEEMPRR